MEINEMKMEDLEARMAEIREAMENPDADLDAMSAEVDQLIARKAEIEKNAETRKELREAVVTEGVEIRSFEEQETPKMEEFNRTSPEYRTAWLKNLAVRSDGSKLFGELNEVEQRAFTFTTANTDELVPTEIENRIIELVASDAPIYDDAKKSALQRGFSVPRHSAINAGDASSVAEGAANADEQDTFTLLPLAGCEIKKHVVISRKMQFQSIDAFEDWLVEHLAARIRVAKENVILARLNGTAPTGGSVASGAGIDSGNILTSQDYDDDAIRNIMSKIKAPGEVVFYANRSTIWNGLFSITDTAGKQLFIPNSMNDPVVQGRIYGAEVKVDSNLSDNVVYAIAKGQVLANDADALYIFSSVEPKTACTITTAYSLFDAGLENPYGAVKASFSA